MDRPPTPLDVAVRFGLGLLAFFLLWRVPEAELLAIPTAGTIGQVTPTPVSTMLVEVIVGAVAGCVFALAARPIWGEWTYRWRLPAALAIIPAAVLGLEILALSGAAPLPPTGAWRSVALFLISGFSLRVTALLLGVALAQGVVPRDERPDDTAE